MSVFLDESLVNHGRKCSIISFFVLWISHARTGYTCRMNRLLVLVTALCLVLSACLTDAASPSTPTLAPTETKAAPRPTITSRPRLPYASPSVTQQADSVSSSQILDAEDWKNWPVLPPVDASLHNIYQLGLARGNDPRAFSIFGDCQERPDEFFGVFETDLETLETLPPELREAVHHFSGSFNRESPTAQDGTTPGALLWTQWHQGKYGCTFDETPVDCELRIHRPSFVIIQVGSHFESRNTEYLRRIILQLLDAGVIPILATKADNREKDERINRDMALLASEYDLPLWNFWAAVSSLPNHGLYTRSDRPLQGDIYLTDEAAEIHRMTGLEALNVVWRAVTTK